MSDEQKAQAISDKAKQTTIVPPQGGAKEESIFSGAKKLSNVATGMAAAPMNTIAEVLGKIKSGLASVWGSVPDYREIDLYFKKFRSSTDAQKASRTDWEKSVDEFLGLDIMSKEQLQALIDEYRTSKRESQK
jgi:hypothetical protein